MRVNDVSIPAVILKMEHYGALGIVRSLGRLGVSVYGVDPHRYAPGFVSKYCRGKFVWDIDRKSDEESVEFLMRVVGKISHRMVLISTSDETARFVARNIGVLRERFVVPDQSAALIRDLSSKKEMFYLARRHALPVPTTFFPSSWNEVEKIVAEGDLAFPVILKGIDGPIMAQRGGEKMVIVRNQSEMKKLQSIMQRETANVMLQEYIPGDEDATWMFNGYFDRQSECLAAFTGRKIHQNPVYAGMTALGECRWNETVSRSMIRFMKEVGFRGILDADLRYDARDGQYKILDVNPRVGASFRLFVSEDGMDVVRALYLDLTHQAVPSGIQEEGRKWLVEDKDLLSGYRYLRLGRLTIRRWLRSLNGVRETGYFDREDLLPFVSMLSGHIVKTFRTMFRRRGWSSSFADKPAVPARKSPARQDRPAPRRIFEDDAA